MSMYSKVEVTLECGNRLAELSVLDGHYDVVGRGYSPMQIHLRPGAYMMRARLGAEQTADMVLVHPLSDKLNVTLPTPDLDSPLRHLPERLRKQLSMNDLPVERGKLLGSLWLRVGVDQTSAPSDAPAQSGDAGTWTLQDADGRQRWIRAAGSVTADGAWEHEAFVPAGDYTLVFTTDGVSVALRLIILERQRLTFMLLARPPTPGQAFWRPDWAGAGLLYEPLARPIKHSQMAVAETLRLALLTQRPFPAESALLRELLHNPACDSMSALYAGYLMLAKRKREKPIDMRLLLAAHRAAAHRIGSGHPDVFALACAIRTRFPDAVVASERPLSGPMLQWSWDALLAASHDPAAVQLAGRTTQAYHDGGAYLRWSPSAASTKKDRPAMHTGANRRPSERREARALDPDRGARGWPVEDGTRRGDIAAQALKNAMRLLATTKPGVVDFARKRGRAVLNTIGQVRSPQHASAAPMTFPAPDVADLLAERMRKALADPVWSAALFALLNTAVQRTQMPVVVRETMLALRAMVIDPHVTSALTGSHLVEIARKLRLPEPAVRAALSDISRIISAARPSIGAKTLPTGSAADDNPP